MKSLLYRKLSFIFIAIILSITHIVYTEEAISTTSTAAIATGKKGSFGIPGFFLNMGISAYSEDGKMYTLIDLNPEFKYEKFAISFSLPLELDSRFWLKNSIVDDTKVGWYDLPDIMDRPIEDILALIKYIRLGSKIGKFYFKFGATDDFYLGHGTVINNYSNMIFYPTIKKSGISFALRLKPFGIEAIAGSIAELDIWGLRFYVNPFFKMRVPIIKNIMIGFFGTLDRNPYSNPMSERVIDSLKTGFTNGVWHWGADLEIPIFKLGKGEIFSISLFADYVNWFAGNRFTDPIYSSMTASDYFSTVYKFGYDMSHEAGFTTGVFGRLFALELRGEYRFYMDGYTTAPYYSAMYDLERVPYLKDLVDGNYSGYFLKIGRNFNDKVYFNLGLEDVLGDYETNSSGERIMMFHPRVFAEFWIARNLFPKFPLSFQFLYEKNHIDWDIEEKLGSRVKLFIRDIFRIRDEDTVMTAKLVYSVNEHIDIILQYRKTFELVISEDNPTAYVVKPIDTIGLTTQIYF